MQRVRDYVQFVDGKIPAKPLMATTMNGDDLKIDQWTTPSIVELLREWRKLSENIRLMEIEVQSVDKLLELLDRCRKDKENYMRQLSVRDNEGDSFSLIRALLFATIYQKDNSRSPACILTLEMNRL